MPVKAWAYRLATTRCTDPGHIRLAHRVIDLLCAQPGLLRQLADEAEKTLRTGSPG